MDDVLGGRDQIPTQGTKGLLSPQWARLFRAMMREKCTEGGLPLFPLILLDRFGGDSSGGFGTVGGLNVRRRGGDRAPCFAARHAKGDGATRQERKDDRLNDFVNLLVAHRFQCMWVRYVVVPARGCWSVGCKGHGR